MAVFLSAHCFGRSEGDCRWYRGEALERFAWVDGRRFGAPVVWVAEGRQANYPSASACDRGHHRLDTCDRNAVRYRFPVRSRDQDIGSRARPVRGDGCLPAEALPLGRRAAGAGAATVAGASAGTGATKVADATAAGDATAGAGAAPLPGAVECFWSPDRPFRGWQGPASGPGVTPYARYLAEVAGF